MAEELRLGQKVPPQSERATVGAITKRIRRGTPEFQTLVKYDKTNVIFKDEEGTAADRHMSPRLRDRLEKLGDLVSAAFPGVKLRVTEAWDENGEHSDGSVHYEGRGADLTTSDRDGRKLGRVAKLAVDAGLDWVFFEDRQHIHVSVRKDGGPAPRAAPAARGLDASAEAAESAEPRRMGEEIGALVDALKEEEAAIVRVGPALTDEEHARLVQIQLALPALEEARRALDPASPDAVALEEGEEESGEAAVAEAEAGDAEAADEVAPAARAARGAAARAAPNPAVVAALEALQPLVRATSHEDAVRFAFQAYFAYKGARPADIRNPFLYFVDYGFDNRTRRGYVFDMARLALVEGPFAVAHGRGSSTVRNAVPKKFSNVPGSATCSLGLYLTQETYDFKGKANGVPYRSIGLRLAGKSGAFNDKARERGVVAHGAPYVTRDDAGRSEGCPAVEEARAQRLLPMIAQGGIVFLFSPNDETWMKRDPWVHRV